MNTTLKSQLSTQQVYQIAELIANGKRVPACTTLFKLMDTTILRDAVFIINKYLPSDFKRGNANCMLAALRWIDDYT
jgi:hypothetical protein